MKIVVSFTSVYKQGNHFNIKIRSKLFNNIFFKKFFDVFLKSHFYYVIELFNFNDVIEKISFNEIINYGIYELFIHCKISSFETYHIN